MHEHFGAILERDQTPLIAVATAAIFSCMAMGFLSNGGIWADLKVGPVRSTSVARDSTRAVTTTLTTLSPGQRLPSIF